LKKCTLTTDNVTRWVMQLQEYDLQIQYFSGAKIKTNKNYLYWRIMLPQSFETPIIRYIHELLGHQSTDKCYYQIITMFWFKNLGRKLRKYIASCENCQEVKHPNRAIKVDPLTHLPNQPGELTSMDLFGPFPTGRGNAKYLLVCLEVFTKFVTLYPLRAATTKGCLKKITEHYLVNVVQPKITLSDHGTKFTSPIWKNTLENFGIIVRYSPIRHPESNPVERVM
ncbi:hypothetical protein B7P43_G18368, partial [Cryptotermes secundus]